jgi:hypothetical protein
MQGPIYTLCIYPPKPGRCAAKHVRVWILLLVVAFLFLSSSPQIGSAAEITVHPVKQTYMLGEKIVITYETPDTKDYPQTMVRLLLEGTENPVWQQWITKGKGTVEFRWVSQPGRYEVQAVRVQSNQVVATAEFDAVARPLPGILSLGKRRTFERGEPISVQVKAPEGVYDYHEWWGEFSVTLVRRARNVMGGGGVEAEAIQGQGLGVGKRDGKLVFTAPNEPGGYEFRLHDRGGLGSDAYVVAVVPFEVVASALPDALKLETTDEVSINEDVTVDVNIPAGRGFGNTSLLLVEPEHTVAGGALVDGRGVQRIYFEPTQKQVKFRTPDAVGNYELWLYDGSGVRFATLPLPVVEPLGPTEEPKARTFVAAELTGQISFQSEKPEVFVGEPVRVKCGLATNLFNRSLTVSLYDLQRGRQLDWQRVPKSNQSIVEISRPMEVGEYEARLLDGEHLLAAAPVSVVATPFPDALSIQGGPCQIVGSPMTVDVNLPFTRQYAKARVELYRSAEKVPGGAIKPEQYTGQSVTFALSGPAHLSFRVPMEPGSYELLLYDRPDHYYRLATARFNALTTLVPDGLGFGGRNVFHPGETAPVTIRLPKDRGFFENHLGQLYLYRSDAIVHGGALQETAYISGWRVEAGKPTTWGEFKVPTQPGWYELRLYDRDPWYEHHARYALARVSFAVGEPAEVGAKDLDAARAAGLTPMLASLDPGRAIENATQCREYLAALFNQQQKEVAATPKKPVKIKAVYFSRLNRDGQWDVADTDVLPGESIRIAAKYDGAAAFSSTSARLTADTGGQDVTLQRAGNDHSFFVSDPFVVTAQSGATLKASLEEAEATVNVHGARVTVRRPGRVFDEENVETVTQYEPLKVEVTVPTDAAKAKIGDTLVVTFTNTRSGKTTALRLKSTGSIKGGFVVYTHDQPVTLAEGGAGEGKSFLTDFLPAGAVNMLKTYDMVELKIENGDTVRVSYADARCDFVAYQSSVQLEVAALRQAFNLLRWMYSNGLSAPGVSQQAREVFHRKLEMIKNADKYLDYVPGPDESFTDLTKLEVARAYFRLLQENPSGWAKAPPVVHPKNGAVFTTREEVEAIGAAVRQAHEEYVNRVFSLITEETIASYQLIMNATGVGQAWTVFTGKDVMGRQVDFTTRVLAGVDIASQLAMLGASAMATHNLVQHGTSGSIIVDKIDNYMPLVSTKPRANREHLTQWNESLNGRRPYGPEPAPAAKNEPLPATAAEKFLGRAAQQAADQVLDSDASVGAAALARRKRLEQASANWEQLTPAEKARFDEAWTTLQKLRAGNPKLAALDDAELFDQMTMNVRRQRPNLTANNPIDPEEAVAITAASNGVELEPDELARAGNVSDLNAQAAINSSRDYTKGAGKALQIPTPPDEEALPGNPQLPAKPVEIAQEDRLHTDKTQVDAAEAAEDAFRNEKTKAEAAEHKVGGAPNTMDQPPELAAEAQQPPKPTAEAQQPSKSAAESQQPSKPTAEAPRASPEPENQPGEMDADTKAPPKPAADTHWLRTADDLFDRIDVKDAAVRAEAQRLIRDEGLGPYDAAVVAAEQGGVPAKKLIEAGLPPTVIADSLDDYLAKNNAMIGSKRAQSVRDYMGEDTPFRYQKPPAAAAAGPVGSPAEQAVAAHKQLVKDLVESRLLKLGVDKADAASHAFEHVVYEGFNADTAVAMAAYEQKIPAQVLMDKTGLRPGQIAQAVDDYHARFPGALQHDLSARAGKVQAYLGDKTPAYYKNLASEPARPPPAYVHDTLEDHPVTIQKAIPTRQKATEDGLRKLGIPDRDARITAAALVHNDKLLPRTAIVAGAREWNVPVDELMGKTGMDSAQVAEALDKVAAGRGIVDSGERAQFIHDYMKDATPPAYTQRLPAGDLAAAPAPAPMNYPIAEEHVDHPLQVETPKAGDWKGADGESFHLTGLGKDKQKIGSGHHNDVFGIEGGEYDGDAIKIGRSVDEEGRPIYEQKGRDAAGNEIWATPDDVVADTARGAEACARAGVLHKRIVKAVTGGDHPYIIQEQLQPGEVTFDHKEVLAGRQKLTDGQQDAVVALYDKLADRNLIWEDGHIENIYFKKTPGTADQWEAGILDTDRIVEWSTTTSGRMDYVLDTLTLPQPDRKIYSVQGIWQPKSAREFMGKMFEYKGRWIEYEGGKFQKRLLDPDKVRSRFPIDDWTQGRSSSINWRHLLERMCPVVGTNSWGIERAYA